MQEGVRVPWRFQMKLSWKFAENQQIALADYSRLVVLVLVLRQYACLVADSLRVHHLHCRPASLETASSYRSSVEPPVCQERWLSRLPNPPGNGPRSTLPTRPTLRAEVS